MKIVNLGCGGTRPQDPKWTNVDNWEGGGHEINEPNFVRHDLRQRLPFDDDTFDGCLLSHVLEHADCQDGLRLLLEIKRVLRPGGIALISVPDVSYFRRIYSQDTNANWPDLFEVSDPPNPIPTWHEAAVWFDQHKVILSEDCVWSYFVRAGFNPDDVHRIAPMDKALPALGEMMPHLNRRKFSLEMWAQKTL